MKKKEPPIDPFAVGNLKKSGPTNPFDSPVSIPTTVKNVSLQNSLNDICSYSYVYNL